MRIFKGRTQLFSNYSQDEMKNFKTVAGMVNSMFQSHMSNKSDIDYLLNYHAGEQPILQKTKAIRPEINHTAVMNNAIRITRTIVGYFLGTPIQYIQAGTTGKDEIDELNRILSYEDKSATDTEIGNNQSITGVGYRLIYTDGENADEVPFETKSLDPSNTFVVYENTVAEKPLAGITYRSMYNSSGEFDGYKFFIYTTYGMYIAESDSEGKIDEDGKSVFVPYSVGGVPIIEYPNNQWRMGDWEFATSLMDAINELQNGRLDDVQQVVEALLVFINAEMDPTEYDTMREAGAIMLKNTTQQKSDIKTVEMNLDQNGMHIFSKEMSDMLDTLVGIPSRDNRAGGGGDTGQAVELRDGWADLEIVARNKESVFKRSEKRALKVVLEILRNTTGFALTTMEVDVKFTRNKNNNLLVKTQSYTNLVATKTVTPEDALSIVDLVSDTNDYATRGKAYWDAETEKAMENMQKTSENGADNTQDMVDNDKGTKSSEE